MRRNTGNSPPSAMMKPCFGVASLVFWWIMQYWKENGFLLGNPVYYGVSKPKKEAAMNDTAAAYRLREQLRKFL